MLDSLRATGTPARRFALSVPPGYARFNFNFVGGTAQVPPMAGVIRVLIADEEPIYRSGLRQVIASDPRCRVIAEAGSARDLLSQLELSRPDVVLVGAVGPARILPEIHQLASDVSIVLLTRRIERAALIRARRIGARGVLLRNASASVLSRCVHAVADGRSWIGRGEQVDLDWDENSRLASLVLSAGLTTRELEVVSVIVEGASNRDIAHLFSISENTVKHHLTRIFEKVGVSSRLELVVRATAMR